MSANFDLNVQTRQGRRNYDILQKTLVGEAAGETEKGQRAVCWVIYNRVKGNKTYWYDTNEGNTIAGVCLKRGQFECWNEGEKRRELEATLKTDWGRKAMAQIDEWLGEVYLHQGGQPKNNPVGKCDHYNNPDKEDRPDWMDRVDFVVKIGNHHFYRTKPEYR